MSDVTVSAPMEDELVAILEQRVWEMLVAELRLVLRRQMA